jgi:hypothetical protein
MHTYFSNALPLFFSYHLLNTIFFFIYLFWHFCFKNSLAHEPFYYEVIFFNDLIRYTIFFFQNRHICNQQLRDWRR